MRVALLALLAMFAAAAQDQSPHAGFVYPAGARIGSSVEVVVGGQFLTGVATVQVTGGGVEALVVKHDRPPTGVEAAKMREDLKALTDRKAAAAKPGATAFPTEDDRRIAEIRAKLADFAKRNVNPAIAERVTIAIAVASDAVPGDREIRISTPNGVTNPLVFNIGRLPEILKGAASSEITLPAVINGQIASGGVDRYRFAASKGQRLVVAVSARRLIPYISDAVPGWFQAAITLRDMHGIELAFADHYRFEPDPVLHYDVEEDGVLTLEIRDSIYRGREDFVYRIIAGDLPYLTDIFPLGGKAGGRTSVELAGWNLPARTASLRSADRLRHVEAVSHGAANALPFAFDDLPETLEKEPNDTAAKPQAVKLPVIVNGRIDKPGDLDVFRFKGRAGEEIVAEVTARRLGSPLDSILKVLDSKGREVAANDDADDIGAGLQTHHADSRILLKLPASGNYYVQIGDAQRKGGAEYSYRLRISRPMPDFELRVSPSSLDAHAGSAVPVSVYALRRDGFSGDIAMSLVDPPVGFALAGGVIPGNTDRVKLTLAVPAKPLGAPVRLVMEGRATVAGRPATRLAAPVEDQMQAFFYHHLVPAKDMLVQVTAARQATAQWKPAGDVRLPLGGTAVVKVAVPRRLANDIRFSIADGPAGVDVDRVEAARDGVTVVLRAPSKDLRVGLRGNLILSAYVERAAAKGPVRRQVLGDIPAIPFEVVTEVKR